MRHLLYMNVESYYAIMKLRDIIHCFDFSYLLQVLLKVLNWVDIQSLVGSLQSRSIVIVTIHHVTTLAEHLQIQTLWYQHLKIEQAKRSSLKSHNYNNKITLNNNNKIT